MGSQLYISIYVILTMLSAAIFWLLVQQKWLIVVNYIIDTEINKLVTYIINSNNFIVQIVGFDTLNKINLDSSKEVLLNLQLQRKVWRTGKFDFYFKIQLIFSCSFFCFFWNISFHTNSISFFLNPFISYRISQLSIIFLFII